MSINKKEDIIKILNCKIIKNYTYNILASDIENTHVEVVINNEIYFKIFSILKILSECNVKRVDLYFTKELINTAPLAKLASRFSSMRYCFQDKLIIRIKNIPYCLIKQPEGVVFFKKLEKFTKPNKCKKCKYNHKCLGLSIYLSNKVNIDLLKPIPDRPREVMIEVESRCNLKCSYCFNKISFAQDKRSIKGLDTRKIKEIINSIKTTHVPIVRFTGGEPLLRTDLFTLANYAKELGLETRLNTNVVLIKNLKQAQQIADLFDNVLVGIRYSDTKQTDKTGRQKIRAIKLLKKARIKILRAGIVATKPVISNLSKVNNIINNWGFDKWEIYRVIGKSKKNECCDQKEFAVLIESLLNIYEQTVNKPYIINALPFCVYDPIKVKAVASGANAVDGHERLAVDPRGFAKPIYYINKNIGDPIDIMACWQHPFMKKLRTLKLTPKECRQCIFLEKCKGGCRFSAFSATGRYYAPDPLMNIDNAIYENN